MTQLIAKTDSHIKHDVLEELKWDTRVRETDVGVEVKGGTVTLTGTVDSWAARLAAQDAAHRVAGVLDVANEMRVKLPGSFERDDTDLAKAVRVALEWDTLVPHERIRTTVSNGVVILEGTLDYWSHYEDAVRAVRNLAGVAAINNLMSVEPPLPRPSADAVRGAIESALERHAEHAAKKVKVAVTDGKVVLSGDVPSWAERDAIEGAVRGTHGVRKVENHLRIA
jgi:osmotically-inducible protein OsmY